jgi:G patch domain/KOW motif-containing protein
MRLSALTPKHSQSTSNLDPASDSLAAVSSVEHSANPAAAAAAAAAAAPSTKLSFGLNTVKSHQLARRATSSLLAPVSSGADVVVPQAIRAVADGAVIPTVPVPDATPLIVPLLDSNGRLDAVTALAASALLRGEAVQSANASTTDGSTGALVVPLLVRGKLDGVDFSQDDTTVYRADVALRPDAPSLEAYANMPVEAIGKAMLMGMGWTEGGGVGRRRQVFEPVDLARRPERLGLGAKIDDEKLPPTHKKRGESSAAVASATEASASTADGERGGAIEPGALVTVTDGRHKGIAGRVVALLDAKSLSLRLASDELVTVKRKYVESGNARKRSKATADNDAGGGSGGGAGAAAADESAKRARKAAAAAVAPIWLRPQIIVRIVSKKYRDAKFYEKKARVLDCVGGERCVVELEDGRVLDDVTQSILENVVGKVGERVQVLRGERCGALGIVLERDSKKELVLVQLDDDSQLHRLGYDDVAKFGAF